MYLLIFLAIMVIIIIVVIVVRKKRVSTSPVGFTIATSGMNLERINRLGMGRIEGEYPGILSLHELHLPDGILAEVPVEYAPEPALDWIIALRLQPGASISDAAVSQLFDYAWRRKFPAATLHGRLVEDGKWTCCYKGDAATSYTELQVGIRLLKRLQDTSPEPVKETLDAYLESIESICQHASQPLTVHPLETVEHARQKESDLSRLYERYHHEMILVLKSENVYDGMKAWRCLQSLGLRWGDGDLFHWTNETPFGHDQFFTVWTTTEPTYFFPEHIKAGAMHPRDLVFGFSVPRSVDPLNVYRIMLSAATYCQRQLGGYLLTTDLKALDQATQLKMIQQTITGMKEQGLIPGSSIALQLF